MNDNVDKQESFDLREARWQRTIENILCEMVVESNDEGIPIFVNVMPAAEAFQDLLEAIRSERHSCATRIVASSSNSLKKDS